VRPRTLKIKVDGALFDMLKVRDDNCNRILVELGEPDKNGFYAPVLTVDYGDNPLKSRTAS